MTDALTLEPVRFEGVFNLMTLSYDTTTQGR